MVVDGSWVISIVLFWLRLTVVTRVVGGMDSGMSFHGHVSSSGLVLSSVEDLFLISVGGFVSDDWDLSV